MIGFADKDGAGTCTLLICEYVDILVPTEIMQNFMTYSWAFAEEVKGLLSIICNSRNSVLPSSSISEF